MKKITGITPILLVTLLALLGTATAGAYDFDADGIYYNITDVDKVTVTYKGEYYNTEDNEYSGAVSIPETVTYDGVTYTVTTIGGYAFYNCNELTSVEIPATVTAIKESAFGLCSNLTDINIPNSVSCIEYYAFTGTAWYENQPEGLIYAGLVAYKYKGVMPDDTCIVLKEGTLGIAGLAFYNCSGMTSIEIPNSVTYIGSGAFKNCSGLTVIEIPNSVTVIELQAFMNTPWYDNQPDGIVYAGKVAYLYKGTMPDNTSIVLEEGTLGISTYAFRSCTGLTNIVIPDSVINIGDGAFKRCSNLKSVSIGKSLASISESAFNSCSALESITVATDNPNYDSRNDCNAIIETRSNMLVVGCHNTVIPNTVTCIGQEAFYEHSALTSIEIPNSVTTIKAEAFYCTGLSSIVIPNSVTSIGEHAFLGCTDLISAEIGNSVTIIDKGAFSGCWRMTSLTIGSSAVSIGDEAFRECNALTTIICHALIPPVIGSELSFSDKSYNNATLFVPYDAVDDYRNAPIWERFITIKPIVPGDVNGDGEITVADANSVTEVIINGGSSGHSHLPSADVNGDGEVNIADVNAIIDIILGGSAPHPSEIETFTVNGVKFKMVEVEGGTFTMGAKDDDSEGHDSQRPAHEVTLSSYRIGQTEVTQALWKAVMGYNPSYFSPPFGYEADLERPVENITWENCQTFIAKLNEMTGKTFRLPTEAEWEFAARGGNKSKGFKYAGSNTAYEVSWYHENSDDKTHPVAARVPNELGLYDMSGNVFEWCQDWYDAYSGEAQTNPTGPDTGVFRVLRGGSWNSDADYSKVMFRYFMNPFVNNGYCGLRLAL